MLIQINISKKIFLSSSKLICLSGANKEDRLSLVPGYNSASVSLISSSQISLGFERTYCNSIFWDSNERIVSQHFVTESDTTLRDFGLHKFIVCRFAQTLTLIRVPIQTFRVEEYRHITLSSYETTSQLQNIRVVLNTVPHLGVEAIRNKAFVYIRSKYSSKHLAKISTYLYLVNAKIHIVTSSQSPKQHSKRNGRLLQHNRVFL